MAKPLSGKEIIEAAQKGIEVLYVYKSYNEFERDRDLSLRIVPKFIGEEIEIDEDETGCLWTVKDMENIDSFFFDLDNGTEAVYAADVSTEREQLKEKLAKFLHEEVWAHWMEHFFNTCGVYIDSPDHEHFGTGKILTIYAGKEQRWRRQMETKYEDLEPQERESDEDLADKLMKLLEE